MAIRVECDSCGSVFSVQDDMSGKQVRCSNCSAIIDVPKSEADVHQPSAGELPGQTSPEPMSVPAPSERSRAATASLVLGILSLVLCIASPLFAIPAIILGIVALTKIKNSEGALGGNGLAIGGIVTAVSSFAMLAIVGLLAALMLPALTRARAKARETLCKNNLKQISMSMMMYSTDFGVFPNKFPDQIKAYLGHNEAILSCPSGGHRVAPGVTHYEYMGQGGPHVRVSSFRQASRTIMIYDDGPIHNGGRNVAYVDGHVQRLSESEFQEQLRNEFNRAWEAEENQVGADR